jgi:DNA-binding XRE family transcriptional regulator
MVMLEETEFDRLLDKADEWEPPLPAPLPNGNFPALEYSMASLARKILRHRRRLRLTQAELARLAGIRPGFLNRIERAIVSPSVRTIEKIDEALRKVERRVARA